MKKIMTMLVLVMIGCGPIQVVDSTAAGQPMLVRSPQPDYKDLVELERLYQIKTIINLRGEETSEEWYQEELRFAGEHNIRLISIALSGRSAPTSYDLQLIFGAIDNPANWPILIHCQGGIHRTGLVVALHRIANQHWSNELAIAELYDNYFRWTILDRSDVVDFLEFYAGSKR